MSLLTLWFGVFNHSHDRLIMFQVLNIPRPKFQGITQHTIPSLEDCCRSDWTLGLTYGLEYNRNVARQVSDSEGALPTLLWRSAKDKGRSHWTESKD